jgi:nitroreductase
MKVENAIKIRRSIRKYQDKKVPDNLINELIDAARLAPSSHNAQPWKFFIIKDKETKEELKANNVFKHPFVYKASVVIICCADSDLSVKPSDIIFSDPDTQGKASRDLAFASQNLVLRATELGLGTCYIGMVDRQKLKEILNIPKNYILPFVIIAGYPDEKPKPTPRKKIKEIIINY